MKSVANKFALTLFLFAMPLTTHAKDKDVIVANDSTQPVPVVVDPETLVPVSVENLPIDQDTGAVAVQVLNPQTEVSITNTEAIPVNVQNQLSIPSSIAINNDETSPVPVTMAEQYMEIGEVYSAVAGNINIVEDLCEPDCDTPNTVSLFDQTSEPPTEPFLLEAFVLTGSNTCQAVLALVSTFPETRTWRLATALNGATFVQLPRPIVIDPLGQTSLINDVALIVPLASASGCGGVATIYTKALN